MDDGSVVAWGCVGSSVYMQCRVPQTARSVTAIAAGAYHSLALNKDGSAIAWGCKPKSSDYGQCRIPATARHGVIAIAAGGDHQPRPEGRPLTAAAICLLQVRYSFAWGSGLAWPCWCCRCFLRAR
jgi:Regulator of chromosome condensation (RCC1) repeat